MRKRSGKANFRLQMQRYNDAVLVSLLNGFMRLVMERRVGTQSVDAQAPEGLEGRNEYCGKQEADLITHFS